MQACNQIQKQIIPVDNKYIFYPGRYDMKGDNVEIGFPGSFLKIKTDAPRVTFRIEDLGENFIQVVVDQKATEIIQLRKDSIEYSVTLPGGTHSVELFKRTESEFGSILFKGLVIDNKSSLYPVEEKNLKIMFIGNSITCGYGNEGADEHAPYIAKTENAYLSYASITARAFNADYHLVAYSGRGIVRNWAQQPPFVENMQDIFERSIADDKESKWDHRKFIPDQVIINLGTNDTSPGYEIEQERFIAGYKNLLNRLYSLYPSVSVVMISSQMVHDNDREQINNWLRSILKDTTYKNLHHLELSEQDGSLGYGADYHPSVKQNEKNAAELISFLKGI